MTTTHDTETSILPEHCPEWCAGGPVNHRRAFEEGCSQADARVHTAGDLTGRTEVDGERTLWNMWLRSDPGPGCVFSGLPYVELETHRHGTSDGFMWQMTSGSARVLARQLAHFADEADLRTG